MTQQQLIREFQTYPPAKKSVVLRVLLKAFEEDLDEHEIDEIVKSKYKLSIEEKKRIVDSLRGSLAIPGKIPPTDEEWREERTNYLLEKYK